MTKIKRFLRLFVLVVIVGIFSVSCAWFVGSDGSDPDPYVPTIAEQTDGIGFHVYDGVTDDDAFLQFKANGRFVWIFFHVGFPAYGLVGNWSSVENGDGYNLVFDVEKESNDLFEWTDASFPLLDQFYFEFTDGTVPTLDLYENGLLSDIYTEVSDFSSLYNSWKSTNGDTEFETVYSVFHVEGEVFDFKGVVGKNQWKEKDLTNDYKDRSTYLIKPNLIDDGDYRIFFHISELWNFSTDIFEQLATPNLWQDTFSFVSGNLDYYVAGTDHLIFTPGTNPAIPYNIMDLDSEDAVAPFPDSALRSRVLQ